jgi:hypothetical protein
MFINVQLSFLTGMQRAEVLEGYIQPIAYTAAV